MILNALNPKSADDFRKLVNFLANLFIASFFINFILVSGAIQMHHPLLYSRIQLYSASVGLWAGMMLKIWVRRGNHGGGLPHFIFDRMITILAIHGLMNVVLIFLYFGVIEGVAMSLSFLIYMAMVSFVVSSGRKCFRLLNP